MMPSEISSQVIDEVKNRLVKTYNPLAIYVFGSHAWGVPTAESDLDLLVVVESSQEKSYKRAALGHGVLFGLGISKDLIVCTKDEFEQRARDVTSLCYKIEKDGKLIYAKS